MLGKLQNYSPVPGPLLIEHILIHILNTFSYVLLRFCLKLVSVSFKL